MNSTILFTLASSRKPILSSSATAVLYCATDAGLPSIMRNIPFSTSSSSSTSGAICLYLDLAAMSSVYPFAPAIAAS